MSAESRPGPAATESRPGRAANEHQVFEVTAFFEGYDMKRRIRLKYDDDNGCALRLLQNCCGADGYMPYTATAFWVTPSRYSFISATPGDRVTVRFRVARYSFRPRPTKGPNRAAAEETAILEDHEEIDESGLVRGAKLWVESIKPNWNLSF